MACSSLVGPEGQWVAGRHWPSAQGECHGAHEQAVTIVSALPVCGGGGGRDFGALGGRSSMGRGLGRGCDRVKGRGCVAEARTAPVALGAAAEGTAEPDPDRPGCPRSPPCAVKVVHFEFQHQVSAHGW